MQSGPLLNVVEWTKIGLNLNRPRQVRYLKRALSDHDKTMYDLQEIDSADPGELQVTTTVFEMRVMSCTIIGIRHVVSPRRHATMYL